MPRIFNKAELLASNTKTNAQLDEEETRLNELHKFRSYAYHHILIAANTTLAAAEVIENNSDIKGFLHPNMDKAKRYDAIPSKSGEGSYVVVINGMTDGEYLINGIDWEVIFDPDAKTSNPHASFVEGTMDILEPKNVRFMKILQTVCNNLKTDPSGLTFILKTIFVGYTDDVQGVGTDSVHQIIHVKPFQFFIYDITGEFTNAGSSYTISFVGQVNGTSRLPAFSTVQQANVSGGTIKEALGSLEDRLNVAAKKAHEDLIKKLDESNNESHDKKGINKSPKGRPVRYVINVNDDFANLPLDNTHIRNQSVAARAQLGTPQGIDIETAISDIMYCSLGIVKMMAEDADQNKGYRTIFKIESALSSSLSEVTITYSVKKCKVPVVTKDNRGKKGTEIAPDTSNRAIYEFDYLYTGGNVEVLEYDMKMAMGLVFFQTLGSTNNLPGKSGQGSGNISTLGNGQGAHLNSESTMIRELTPIPIPANISDPAARNKVEPAKTADYRTFMARQAMLESVESKLRIVGIPWLLEAFNMTPLEAESPNVPAHKESIPLIKVRVRMPTDDFKDEDGNPTYAEDFWYEGYFYIISCKNSFRDGRFEQELDLIAMVYEELVTPSSSKDAPSSSGSKSGTKPGAKPSTAPGATQRATDNKTPTNTAEQKAKNGAAPITLTEKEQLNCESIRQQPRPFTMEVARRTMLSKNISLQMLTRNQLNLSKVDDRILKNLCTLAKKLEEVQSFLGNELRITSGFRCAEYNAKVRGADKSDHMHGIAADFQVNGMSTERVYEALQKSGIDVRQVIHERSARTSWIHMSFNIDSTVTAKAGRKFFTMVV